MDTVETVSRAYAPQAWERIDRLTLAARSPLDPQSLWPDMRSLMAQLAATEASHLYDRMCHALLSGARMG
jgi:hypothetical protein